MKTLVVYLGKKYAISAINDLLKKYQDNVTRVSETIDVWIGRLEKIVSQLKAINARVADGEITSEEVSTSMEEIEKLVKEF